jgi:DNA-binding SARP family transcriptional activator
MITRARTMLTGLAALTALAAVVAGLPVVLYRFGGSPLPAHLASWHRLATVLTSRDNGSLLLSVIRECSWLAWLLFTVCVLAEAQAALRGRRAPRLRLGGMQNAASHLVALAALTFAAPAAVTLSASVTAVSSQHSQAAADNQPQEMTLMTAPQYPASHPVVSQYRADQPPAGPHQAAQDPVAQDPAAPAAMLAGTLTAAPAHATRLITVRPGDCLWSLAQRYLGAGDRYPEIFSLNYGHEMANGQRFTSPSLIEPGWQLFLPGDGTAPAAAAASGSHHLGHGTKDAHYRRRHPAARHRTAEEHAAHPAGNVSSGAKGSSPAAASAGTVSPAAPGTAGSGDQLSGQPAGYSTPAESAPDGSQLPAAAVFVTGALAGAVVTSLNRLRRSQRQARRRGRRIALPAGPEVLAAEQRLRAVAPAEPLETLRDALSCLEEGIIGSGQELPDIVGLHVTPDALEVLLSAPAADAPPAPYAISPGRQGMCWQLDLPAAALSGTEWPDQDLAGQHGCHLLAGLVTAGATGDGYLLLDLEALRVTGCDGPPELVDQVVATAATELAAGQWSGWYELLLVGCDELAGLGRAEHCPSFDEALTILESRAAVIGHRAAERGPADLRELRLAEPDDEDWTLTILVSRIVPEPEQLRRLLELAEDGPGGLAALVAGDQEAGDGRMAPTVLQVAPDPGLPGGIIANIVPLQITVRPRVLTGADYEAITSLFSVAADTGDVGSEEEPYLLYAAPPWIPAAAALHPKPGAPDLPWPDEAAESPPAGDAEHDSLPGTSADGDGTTAQAWPADHPSGPIPAIAGPGTSPWTAGRHAAAAAPLQVQVLGPFAICGAAEQLQPKQAELVLALALAAPAGLSNSALCSMLGPDPDHAKPSDSVRQIITRTRRRLGTAPDGQEYIIHAGNGHYLLHPAAQLDWSAFRQLVASGRADDLRSAVSLISGQPFTGSYFWWIDIPLIETVRAELVDAAETLSEFELATGSARAAARAARAGLLAESSAEQLWRAVMRAEHATGNLAGVTEAWRRCLDAIEDIAPGGEPHPDTEALYRQLTMAGRQHVPAR